ncbi:MAG: hypothetical protein LUQ31_07815 [Methanoregula sp.]|nr:hypothetical protein [Methanoregula sp.]
MSKFKTVICAGAALLVLVLMIGPAAATQVDTIVYQNGVYTQNENFSTTEIHSVTEIVGNTVGESGSMQLPAADGQMLQINRYALVSYPGQSIAVSFTLTTPQTVYSTGLQNPVVTIESRPVTGNTLVANGNTIHVQGFIPDNATSGQEIAIIRLSDVSDKTNSEFLLHITTPEKNALQTTLYDLNQKLASGGSDSLTDSLQKALDKYNSGNYEQGTVLGTSALEESKTRSEGFTSGMEIGAVIAVILAAIGLLAGYFIGKWKATRPDLLKIETIVRDYYKARSENPFGQVKIPADCKSALEHAFDFNASRAEILKKQREQPGSPVTPDTVAGESLKPSLFQALYEKVTYGRCPAFDDGIAYLTKNINGEQQKKD